MPHLMKTSLRKKMRMRKKFKITLSWKLMIKFSHWLRTNLHKPLNLLLSMLFYPLCQFIRKNNLAQFHLVSPFFYIFPTKARPGCNILNFKFVYFRLFIFFDVMYSVKTTLLNRKSTFCQKVTVHKDCKSPS